MTRPIYIQDSLEDRVAQSGRTKEFVDAMRAWEQSDREREDENELYDVLTSLGSPSEEADEFISMLLQA